MEFAQSKKGNLCLTVEVEHSCETLLNVKAKINAVEDMDRIQFVLRDAKGQVLNGQMTRAEEEICRKMEIPDSYTWNRKVDQCQYKMTAELIRGDRVLDTVTIPLQVHTN